jgi:magnesium transporter
MLKTYDITGPKISECLPAENPVLVFTKPDENEKKRLVEEFKIDEHTLASALDPDELARLEFEPEHTAIIFKHPKFYTTEDRFYFRVASSGLFLFKDKLIVVTSDDFEFMCEGSTKIFTGIKTIQGFVLWLLYRSVFHFLGHLKAINNIASELEGKINTAMENSHLLNLFSLSKSLVYYLNAINSNSALMEKLKANVQKIGFRQDEIEFLDDTNIEINQCRKHAEIYSNIIASLMDARASIVSNNLNVLIKKLNILTIGVMVPTFVVSAFSMNVALPFMKESWAFWMILGLAMISALLFLLFYGRTAKNGNKDK